MSRIGRERENTVVRPGSERAQNPSPVRLHNPSRDVEAETGALARRARGAAELLEQARQLVGPDAAARVLDGEHDPVAVRAGGHRHHAACRTRPQRVVHQIGEHPFDLAAIGNDR